MSARVIASRPRAPVPLWSFAIRYGVQMDFAAAVPSAALSRERTARRTGCGERSRRGLRRPWRAAARRGLRSQSPRGTCCPSSSSQRCRYSSVPSSRCGLPTTGGKRAGAIVRLDQLVAAGRRRRVGLQAGRRFVLADVQPAGPRDAGDLAIDGPDLRHVAGADRMNHQVEAGRGKHRHRRPSTPRPSAARSAARPPPAGRAPAWPG